MRIISFGWTSEAVCAGVKTFTWRDWKDAYARSFHEGERLQGYNHSQRQGGSRIAIIELVAAPLLRHSSTLQDADYEAEGLAWMAEHPESWPERMFGKVFDPYLVSRAHFDAFRESNVLAWDIRFRVVELSVPWRGELSS